MIKVVVDTNVLVSALLSPEGNPAKILSLVLNNKLMLCFDSSIILEYEDVLSRKKFSFKPQDVAALIYTINQLGVSFVRIPSKFEFIDEADRKFFEAALSSNAYLITGNTKHFPKESFVVSPSVFIEKIWMKE